MTVSELAEKIPSVDNANTVLFDGVVTQRLLDIAVTKNIKYVIGDRVSDGAKRPANVSVMTLTDLSSFGPNWQRPMPFRATRSVLPRVF